MTLSLTGPRDAREDRLPALLDGERSVVYAKDDVENERGDDFGKMPRTLRNLRSGVGAYRLTEDLPHGKAESLLCLTWLLYIVNSAFTNYKFLVASLFLLITGWHEAIRDRTAYNSLFVN